MTILYQPADWVAAAQVAIPASSRAVNQLLIEARKAEDFGKPLAAALMHALARVLPGAEGIFDAVEHWPGDLANDGVIFRLNAGLHALALAGREPGVLRALYEDGVRPSSFGLEAALAEALDVHACELLGWLAHPTQTNETLRVAGLVAALLELGRERALPCEVLELGASAGLNLNFPRYAVKLGTMAACAPESPVLLQPEWRGLAAARGAIAVTRARGVDLHPLNVADDADRESLKAYVWPGEMGRAARLEAAIGLALKYPTTVDMGLASAWLNGQLAVPQRDGVRRVVFHSMVLQYADAAERAAIDAAFAAAAAAGASRDRPIARVSIEWRADRQAVELRIAEWDGGAMQGTARLAAICHPYGEWIDWRGLA